MVVKILKPILKEDKEIKCKKCKNSFQTVNGFVGHIEKCCGVISSNGLVTCAVCKTEMEKKKWPNHKQRQHNNLAWRIGDRPLVRFLLCLKEINHDHFMRIKIYNR